jgi:hypothetical protein
MINQHYLSLLREFIANPSSETWEPLIGLKTEQGFTTVSCFYKTFVGDIPANCPIECEQMMRPEQEDFVEMYSMRHRGVCLCYYTTRQRAWASSPGETLALAIQFLSFILSRNDE